VSRRKRARSAVGKDHRVTKDEAIKWFEEKYDVRKFFEYFGIDVNFRVLSLERVPKSRSNELISNTNLVHVRLVRIPDVIIATINRSTSYSSFFIGYAHSRSSVVISMLTGTGTGTIRGDNLSSTFIWVCFEQNIVVATSSREQRNNINFLLSLSSNCCL
jgi:hypothetical protein